METREIVIVGSGPAGCAVAAALARRAPGLAAGALMLERARHPRVKLCGGGLTPLADDLLGELDLRVPVPSIAIEHVRIDLDDGPMTVHYPNRIRMVRRAEFDAALAKRARELGVELREETPVRRITRDGDAVLLETDAGAIRPRVVVGADGAKGAVRRALVEEPRSRVSRLMEVLVPVDAAAAPEFRERMVVFDFRRMRSGLQGYLWNFPNLVDGKPHLSVGIFDSRVTEGPRAPLKDLLAERLDERGLGEVAGAEGVRFEGHPERWFSPAGRYAAPNVILAGDAAGVEPWLGEGISLALAYGPVAAEEVARAFETGDFTFAGYRRRLLGSPVGGLLRRNQLIARLFYQPWFRPLVPAAMRGLGLAYRQGFFGRWFLRHARGITPSAPG
jgi:flavin-dependent dehydrogenase